MGAILNHTIFKLILFLTAPGPVKELAGFKTEKPRN